MNFLQIILQIQPVVFAIFAAKLWPMKFHSNFIHSWFDLVKHRETAVQIERVNKKCSNTVMKQHTKKISFTYKPKNWKINWKISPTSKYIRVKFFIPIKLTVFSFRVQVNAFYTSFSVFAFCFCSKKKRERERIMGERYVEHTFMVFFTIRGVCMRC